MIHFQEKFQKYIKMRWISARFYLFTRIFRNLCGTAEAWLWTEFMGLKAFKEGFMRKKSRDKCAEFRMISAKFTLILDANLEEIYFEWTLLAQ